MDSLTFLDRLDKAKPQPLYVLKGDEEFLRRQVHLALRRLVLGPGDEGFAVSTYPGDKAAWAEVLGDLQTLPFLAPRRLVIVENADPFVTRERGKLEKYFAEVAGKGSSATGVLVLDVQNWAANTKLAKATPDASLIECKAPPSQQLPQWAAAWSASRHGKPMAAGAAKLLVDLIGPEMGLLDKEIEKLAIYAGDAAGIEAKDVDALVGRSRAENTWHIFDLIGKGAAGEALTFLQRLFDQGEDPMRLLGAFSSALRKLAQASRLSAQGVPLAESMSRAGIVSFGRQSAEQQMRHLGRRRLDRLYDWLLETDSGMKGGSQLPATTLLERLVVRLARART
jgi:DNA polymerase-3 subunit delta